MTMKSFWLNFKGIWGIFFFIVHGFRVALGTGEAVWPPEPSSTHGET